MIHKNDLNKYKVYNKESNKKILQLFILLTIVGIAPVYASIYKLDEAPFILLFTLIAVFISGFIGLHLGTKKSKKIYESTEIEVIENSIKYTDIEKTFEIKTQEIKSIQKDNIGNISVFSNSGEHIKITSYVENYSELQSNLEQLSEIKDSRSFAKIINNLPLIFFFGVMASRYIPYLQFYIFFGIGYILLTLWSVFTNIKTIVKKPFQILLNGMLLYVCYIVGKAIYTIIMR